MYLLKKSHFFENQHGMNFDHFWRENWKYFNRINMIFSKWKFKSDILVIFFKHWSFLCVITEVLLWLKKKMF